MRILIASSSRTPIGGIERYLQTVIPELLNRGHALGLVHEIPSDGGATIDPRPACLPTWCLAQLGPERTLELVRDWRPEVVYSHGLDSPELENGLIGGYASVLYTHSYNGACVSGRKCHAFPSLRPCARALGPGCLALYHVRRCGGLNPFTLFRMYTDQGNRLERIRHYREVLVASRHMQREFGRYPDLADRVRLLPLPLTDEISPAVPAPREPTGRLLYVGRLVDVKGVDYLIRAIPLAARRLPFRLTLTVVGDGPARDQLVELARRLHVAVEFTGWLDGSEKQAVMQSADLIAVPSLWPEPFGLVGIEVGQLGVPAVGFAVGGIPDWLIAGVSGELAPGAPPRPEGLADAIVRALSDPQHYDLLRAGAREVAGRFSLEKHVRRLEAILKRLTGDAATADGNDCREDSAECLHRRA